MIALVATLARGFAIIFKRSCRLLLIACLITGSLKAADNPFVGKWKLNGSKSRLRRLCRNDCCGRDRSARSFRDYFLRQRRRTQQLESGSQNRRQNTPHGELE